MKAIINEIQIDKVALFKIQTLFDWFLGHLILIIGALIPGAGNRI